jgi:hypothetical protein
MRWILNLDILLLISGIARKHGIVPKPFLGRPQYSLPQKKILFFQEHEISQEREFVASQISDYKKMFLIVQTYLGGQSSCSSHLTPQIQGLPAAAGNWNGPIKIRRSSRHVESLSTCRDDCHLLLFCHWFSERGAKTWGFHESPSYPHMYCFLAWRERMESSTEKTLRWNTIVIGDFLNLGSVSHECCRYQFLRDDNAQFLSTRKLSASLT